MLDDNRARFGYSFHLITFRMKNNLYPHAWHRAPLCFLPSVLLALALALLPGSASAQSCANLLPNPSFEAQNVSPLSGYQGNVYAPFQSGTRDELTGWQSTKNLHAGYFATNAPSGSDSNPSSSSSVFPFFPLQPHTGIGMLGITGYHAYGYADYATMRSGPLTLTAGDYYASFWVYCPPANGVFSKIGMNLTTANPLSSSASITYQRSATSIESSGYVTQPSWQKVDGIITILAPGSYYVNIGNFSYSDFIVNPSSSGYGSGTQTDGSYYFIDDVELSPTGQVGLPAAPALQQLPNDTPCSYPAAVFQITNYDPLLTYHVSVPIPGPLRIGTGVRSDGTFVVNVCCDGGVVTVTATSSCGTTSSQSDVIYVPCEMARYTLFPNPATNEVLIQQSPETASNRGASAGTISAVQVYDSYGKLRLEQAASNTTAIHLRTDKLPAGLYTVHILHGREIIDRQKLQIKE
jgi:hypothetical protein